MCSEAFHDTSKSPSRRVSRSTRRPRIGGSKTPPRRATSIVSNGFDGNVIKISSACTWPDGPLAVRPRTRALPRRQRLINRLGSDCCCLSLAWFLPAAIRHLDTGDGHRKLDDIVARVPFPHDSDVTATGALRRFEPDKLVRLSQWRPFPFQLDSALSPLSNPMWPLSAAPAQP